jgi:hypothetical protein
MNKYDIIKTIISCGAFISAALLVFLRTSDDKIAYFIIAAIVGIIYIMISFDIKVFFFKSLDATNVFTNEQIHIVCDHDIRKECCVNEYIKALKSNDKVKDIIMSQGVLDKYKLVSVSEMNKKEKEFRTQNTKNRQIWVFSYNLSTEILGDESQSIVKENLKKGIQYHEFVIYNDETSGEVDKNTTKLMQSISVNSRQNIHIEHISESNDFNNILSYLIGSIIFVDNNKPQSYFSLRGDNIDKSNPIYFKMPNCMNEKYYKYFKSKINNNKEVLQ